MNAQHVFRIGVGLVLAPVLLCNNLASAQQEAKSDRWLEVMADFEKQDASTPFEKGGIVFVGSSSIRKWKLGDYFADLSVLNRGFGGSEISDSIQHIETVVLKHEPKTLVFYAGDNDVGRGKSPEVVAKDFKTFAAMVHDKLPQTRIAYIAIKPSISRWRMIDKIREANAMIRKQCDADDRMAFVDIDGPMMGWDAKPNPDLYLSDGLHMTEEGYAVWAAILRPFLKD